MKKRELAVLALSLSFLILSGCVNQESVKEKAITVEELWENRDFYLGKEVMVSGVIQQLNTICTANECDEQNPCCQSCGSSLFLRFSKEIELPFYGEFNGKEVLCRGTNCNLTCYPFQSGKNYTTKVLLKKTEAYYYLELLKILR